MKLLAEFLNRPRRMAAAAILIIVYLCGWNVAGCADNALRSRQIRESTVYPPPPQPTCVVALGNLRGGAPPSNAKIQWSLFLFGETPDSSLMFVRPISVTPDRSGLLVCDSAYGALVRWQEGASDLNFADLTPRPLRPVAATVAPGGDLLVADAKGGAVSRFDSLGKLIQSYRMSPEEFRPAAVVVRQNEVWVSNVLGHRIEVFDGPTGAHRGSIGRRGGAMGEFGAPLGMALTPDGNLCVVDMLNARIQVLDAAGKCIRTIGGPGDVVGRFGRPKGVAVGPDGTIFVTDAASQRVQAFDGEGRALIAFGGPSEGLGALSVPGGLCIDTRCPIEEPALPEGFTADYYVLVAEQLLRPGIRVYAWGHTAGTAMSTTELSSALATASGTVNPHWNPNRCTECHHVEAGVVKSLRGRADELCISCHDGKRARAEAHPIARLASTAQTTVPKGWPLVDDRLGCLTCHDIRRHCDSTAKRPAMNPAMLRAFEPDQPMKICTQCHQAGESWRVSPHRNLDAAGQVIASSCAFCHVRQPPLPVDGKRTGEALLHVDGSKLCLTCHSRHWDVSLRGHVDRPASEHTRQIMSARGVSSLFPLSGGQVTCYSCHNPHQAGLFRDGSTLGERSTDAADAHAALRAPSAVLCLQCHSK